MKYSFKRLGPSDVGDFKKLLLVFLEVFEETPYETKDSDLKILLDKQDYYAVAAFDKDIVMGGVTGYEFRLPNQEKEIYLYDLGVDEKYRKQGVATALVEELKMHARRNGVSVIFVEAESKELDAVGFYKSLETEQIKVEHFNIEL